MAAANYCQLAKEDIITWGAQLLLLLTFLESQFEEDKTWADFHNANNDKTCAGAESHKGFVQLGLAVAVSWSKRAAVAVSRQFRTCVYLRRSATLPALIGNNRWCVVERVCTGQMSGNSELARRVYSKVGVRLNSGVHISRFALWASAWAVVDVDPTQDIKKRNSLSITQPNCSLQKTCQTVQKCKAVSSSIAYFSIYGLLLFGLENKSLLVSKSSGWAGEWVASSCPAIFNWGPGKRYYLNHF